MRDIMDDGAGKTYISIIKDRYSQTYRIKSDISTKEKSIILSIANVLRAIADFILGVKYRYPVCCIKNYIINKEKYLVKGIERGLCRKCYLKVVEK